MYKEVWQGFPPSLEHSEAATECPDQSHCTVHVSLSGSGRRRDSGAHLENVREHNVKLANISALRLA